MINSYPTIKSRKENELAMDSLEKCLRVRIIYREFKSIFRLLLLVVLYYLAISTGFVIDNYDYTKIKNTSIGIYRTPAGEQEVAIKVPKITFNTHSPVEAERMRAFLEEAKITSGFDHENILSCLGISTGLLCHPPN